MTMPSFAAFFEALWGYAPFAWQVRLAEEVLTKGWPDVLDLPTGVGKTSALDVAMYCLARSPERMPRRTVLVVDRRIVVDQGAERVRAILQAMRRASDGPVAAVAAALRQVWLATPEVDPFAVAVMRGGMPRDNDWAARPDQPVFGVSTVDQVGSRLLFRGYGVSERSVSIHAGLIGNDTLILLDEVHLAIPFAETLQDLSSRFMPVVDGLPHRFRVVQMSATVGTLDRAVETFTLQPSDRQHPVLARRLRASKQVTLELVKASGDDERAKAEVFAAQLAKAALALQSEERPVVGVVVNRIDTARVVAKFLEKQAPRSVILVTGRMRAIDRDKLVRDQLLPCCGPRAMRVGASARTFVVATQCIEAGADLDFDALVSECASLDALRQRFGRLDRDGQLGVTQARILVRSDAVAVGASDAIYEGALAATWRWLSVLAAKGGVDFGIEKLPVPEGPELDALVAPRSSAPVLLPAHVDAWSQTSPVPDYDPDIALWLHGPQETSIDVQVVWRSDLDEQDLTRGTVESLEAVVAGLAACRPSSLESVSLPVGAVRKWLAGEQAAPIADVAFAAAEVEESRTRRRSQKRENVALAWRGESSAFVTADQIRPGQVLVVPHVRGGIARGNFDASSTDPVTDLGDLAQLRGRGIATLRLVSAALEVWGLPSALLERVPEPVADEPVRETRQRVEEWLDRWGERGDTLATEYEWHVLRGALTAAKRPAVLTLQRGDGVESLVISRRVDIASARQAARDAGAEGADGVAELLVDALTEDDDSSFRAAEVTLDAHSADVGSMAQQFAQALQLGPFFERALHLAGLMHDAGKADPRFQRWLRGGVRAPDGAPLLAKSALPPGSQAARRLARTHAGYPDGYRHELLSLAMLQAQGEALHPDPELRELVLHLVGSHHGWCRPFGPPVRQAGGDVGEVKVALSGVPLAAPAETGAARIDAPSADRYFRLVERYGTWGLAWLEAILRLADHRASELAEEKRRG